MQKDLTEKPQPISNVYHYHEVVEWLKATGREKEAGWLHDYFFGGEDGEQGLEGIPFDDRKHWDKHYDPQHVQLFRFLETEFPTNVLFNVTW